MLKKIDRTFSREELYNEIWTISLSKTAAKYSIPASKLRSACIEYDIPLPTNSYWGRISTGKTAEKIPLPPFRDDTVKIVYREQIKRRRPSEESALELSTPASDSTKLPVNTNEIEYVQTESDLAKKDFAQIMTRPIEKRDYAINERNTYDRETLYKEVWAEAVTTVAKRYGVSDVAIRKICKSMSIPLPPLGYWAKKRAGPNVSIPPLPPYEGPATKGGNRTYQTDEQAEITSLAEQLSFLSEEETASLYHVAQGIMVKEAGQRLHPKVVEYKTKVKEWEAKHNRDILANWKTDRYARLPEDEPTFWRQLSPDIFPRVCRLLDAIYRAIESLGGKVTDKYHVVIRGEHVPFSIMEGQEKVAHQLTKEEQKQLASYENGKSYYRPNFRKYDYRPNGRIRIDILDGSYFRDTDQILVEERLDEILIALYIKSESERKLRLEREEKARREAEEKRQRELRRERYNHEVDRVNALLNEADDYAIACKIRQYVTALEQCDLTEEGKEFVAWAKQKADWFDPTVAVKDPVFGERAHGDDAQRKKLEHQWGYRW